MIHFAEDSMDKSLIDSLWNENIDGYLDLLRINSVYDEGTVSDISPYGNGVKKALDYMRDQMKASGFLVKEYNNEVVSGETGDGSDDERIDIVSHLDVVEPGDGWIYPPFDPIEKDGRIYARGSQDMKIGAWLTFIALRHLRDNGLLGKRKIRLVYGSDEERWMEDMKRYIDKEGEPAFAFTPDGQFPVTLGEKGIGMWVLCGDYSGHVKELRGGVQANVIPAEASAIFDIGDLEKIISFMNKHHINGEVEPVDQGIKITVHGVSAHASKPEMGHNATIDLLRIGKEVFSDSFLGKMYDFFYDPRGKGAGMEYDIEPMGELSLNLGIFNIINGKAYAEIDCRYPYGADFDVMTARYSEVFPELDIDIPYHSGPTLADKDSPFIIALGECYRKVTGSKNTTFISGGVSYAKVIKNCVNFGTTLEGREYVAHQKNEYIDINDMKQVLEIYMEAIKSISNL